MIVRQLSPSGDYQFGSSLGNYLQDSPAAVAQVIQTSLKLFLGEWFLDVTVGMNWFEGVVGKFSQANADAAIQSYILQVQGVTGIQSFSSEINTYTRQYSVTSCVINTQYGVTQVQINNYNLF